MLFIVKFNMHCSVSIAIISFLSQCLGPHLHLSQILPSELRPASILVWLGKWLSSFKVTTLDFRIKVFPGAFGLDIWQLVNSL